ncbi:MAG: DEAD/DEAH box helicase family protein [Desulfosporosinus sp.]|nr:DEAD/DEAH box helicase family protein [Desulfosporosinus sp.]
MSLKDVELKSEYRSLIDSVAKDFYIPLLKQAVTYKRAVGFFSSSALAEISKGILGLVKNGGTIQLVASPHLSHDDVQAMKKGYELREKIIENALLRELHGVNTEIEQDRLNLLASLIADGVLDIKIALTEQNGEIGMYHEKMGIIADSEGNKVAFSGSMNESATAMTMNYEAIDVFCSWLDEKDRVASKENAFTAIWNNVEPNIVTMDFPNVRDEIIKRYRSGLVLDPDRKEFGDDVYISRKTSTCWISKPDYVKFHDYQIDAMISWEIEKYRGIFDMATGTGKTYTALGALEVLCKKVKSNLGIFIVCPYQHLVEQWVTDIKAFGIKPLICYSGYDWKKKYKSMLSDFKLGVIQNFCVVTTNATFATEVMQKEINKLKGNVCLVVDEAHNFGAKKQLECMKEVFKYRLALSATLERHHDNEGTQKLKDYFGNKCIEYTLARAIKEDKLTPYYYHPIPIYLDEDELEAYIELTEKIIKLLQNSKKDEPMPKLAEMLLIKRARIIAGARNKLKALYEIIKKQYVTENQILVYCGATTIENSSYVEGKVDEEEKRQIEIVVDMLGNNLDMRVSKFTSEENVAEREMIKENFADGNMLQALIAIRCLDEGVNIPGIRTAFILASSTNPKEYIQRRGRVLRKAPNKPFARIYDFITLPRDIDEPMCGDSNLNKEYSLIRREYERMEDFARLAENSSDVAKLKEKIDAFYKLNYIGGKDYGI